MWDVKAEAEGTIRISEVVFYLNYVGCKAGSQLGQKMFSPVFYLNYVGCKVIRTY